MKHPLSQITLLLALSAPLYAQEWKYERAPTRAVQQRLNVQARLLPLMPRLRLASMPHPNFTPPGFVLVYQPPAATVSTALPAPQVRTRAKYVPPSQDDTNPFDYLFSPADLAEIKAMRRAGVFD